ncbi:MAG TPA: replicative DNA helicase [Clostridia bacterium]|nr:replicative DNA helicase [Clostridia bacterium]
MSIPLDRVPPQNLEAEQSVLGSMLLAKEAIDEVTDLLSAQDFYRDSHRYIFEAILSLYAKQEPVDLITLAEELKSQGLLEKVGGASYLALLASMVPTAANARYYAQIVAEKSLLRSLISACTSVIQQCYEAGEEAAALLDEAEKLILQVSERRRFDGFTHVKPIILEVIDQLDMLAKHKTGVTGIPTFEALDRYLSGLHKSDLIICAARPGMGKTAFCLNIAQKAAMKSNIPVAIFSLEMSKDQLTQRLLSAEAMVDQSKLRSGFLTPEDWQRVTLAAAKLAEAPIYIDDTPGITVMEMRAKSRRLKVEKDLGLVIVDYLQLMQSHRRVENRQQEISEISRSLKSLARELDVPVLALSQLSRAVEQSPSKRPALSHLRESGSLEQDADVVLFIHRPDYYDPDSAMRGIAEIIIAKHRHGPTGSVELAFAAEYTRFLDLAKE